MKAHTTVIVTLLGFATLVQANVIVIDSFVTPGGQPLSSNRGSVSGPGILGGERDTILDGFSGGQNLAIGNGQVVFDSPAGIIGGSIEWDGVQGGQGLPDRARQLPVTDFTSAGVNNALSFNIISISGTWEITPTITTGISDQADTVVSGVTTAGQLTIPFSGFTLRGSPDLTMVDGIDIRFRPTSVGSSITFGPVEVVPEPSSITLLSIGIACVLLVIQVRRRGLLIANARR